MSFDSFAKFFFHAQPRCSNSRNKGLRIHKYFRILGCAFGLAPKTLCRWISLLQQKEDDS
jgi:hypothetical protein